MHILHPAPIVAGAKNDPSAFCAGHVSIQHEEVVDASSPLGLPEQGDAIFGGAVDVEI